MADHGHHHHDHDHLPIIEEPLDPANKSLADALQISFRLLKLVMLIVVVFYVFSNVRSVEEKTVQVRWRFGEFNAELSPGLHFSFPTPIDELIEVRTSLQSFTESSFWVTVPPGSEGQELSSLMARSESLEPGRDGALLTADKALWHVKLEVRYHIENPEQFVANVKMQPQGEETSDSLIETGPEPEEALIRPIIRAAAVAEAARTHSQVIWKRAGLLASRIQARAQQQLDDLETGIVLDKIEASQSHYPLQTNQAFVGVSNAEARMQELIQDAQKYWEETLKSAAGQAWEPLYAKIKLLDTVDQKEEKQKIIDDISRMLIDDAKGEAGRLIQLARGNRDRIIDETRGRVSKFNALLEEYGRSPQLVRQRQLHQTLRKIFSQIGVMRWVLPETGKVALYLNEDPVQLREIEKSRLEQNAQQPR